MDFLGIGSGEIFLIIVIALILWGPGRIVEIARTMGKIVNNFKKMSSDLATQITQEVDLQNKANASKPGENQSANSDTTRSSQANSSIGNVK